MINNQPDIVEVDIIPPQQRRPEKTLTQKKTEATLRKIAPMLAILKKEGLSHESKEKKVIKFLTKKKPEDVLISDDVIELAWALEFLIENQKELFTLVTHVYHNNEKIIGDDQNSFINKMQETFSKKTCERAQYILSIMAVIALLFMTISVIMEKLFDKGGLVVFLLAGLLVISMCIIGCVACCLMILGCTPRSLCLKVFAKEEIEVKAMLNQVFVAPPPREFWARELEGSLNIEEMNALLTIINNYLQSLKAPTKSAQTDRVEKREIVNVSHNSYGSFAQTSSNSAKVNVQAPKKLDDFEIHLDSDAPVPDFT